MASKSAKRFSDEVILWSKVAMSKKQNGTPKGRPVSRFEPGLLLLGRRLGVGLGGRSGRRRGRSSCGRVGRLVATDLFDLGFRAQFLDQVGLRLALDIGFDLVLDLIEGRRLLGTLVVDANDVPA